MKITKRQLRRIIKEEKARLLSEAPSSRATIYDMDNGQTLNLSARPEPHAGFISFSIGSSFRMALDPEDLDVIVKLLESAKEDLMHAQIESQSDPGANKQSEW